MFLKNIELSGFKSFADKVTLEFSERISAIIGPNGSGKSNIVDAIKWVLGEQSVKSLRGKSMEEVIFNGTTTRKPLSRASVSMTLVNEKGLLPVAFKEVTVSRQLYRSGESKYLINNAECRLKDVIELFMDTGLSKGAYSIISQGQISSILTANPYDRRLIFEEAAGIVKYKTRKKIALSKLEAAKQDLLRVSDILIELERQLRSLKYQAAKAERYKKVAEQLELTELLVSFFEYSALVEEITNINNERQIYLDKKTEIETKIAKENSEYEKQKITLFEIDTKVSEISKKIYELSEAIKQKEYKLMSNSNKIDNNLFKINQYSDETRELKFKIEELDKKINEENSQLLNASVKLLENIIDSEREKKNILDIENVLSENNKILDEYNKELLDKTHNSSEYKSRLNTITTELRTVKIQQQEIKEKKINKELQIA
ncbi:MAG TPA: AAA family ATPase, partial [bacterium]|nr:AAA family ATPase [bacterium]